MGFRSPIAGGEDLIRSGLRSPSYVAGVTGWRIAQDGSAEFNGVTIRGDLATGKAGAGPWIFIPDGLNTIYFYTDDAKEINPGQITAQVSGGGQVPQVYVTSPTFRLFEAAFISLEGPDTDGVPASNIRLAAVTTNIVGIGGNPTSGDLIVGGTITAGKGVPWTPYTPVFTASGGATAGGTKNGKYRWNGRDAIVQADITLTAGMTLPAGVYFLSLPPGMTAAAGTFGAGAAMYHTGGLPWSGTCSPFYSGAGGTKLAVALDQAGAPWGQNSPVAPNIGHVMTMTWSGETTTP